jgi:hypothetical protein
LAPAGNVMTTTGEGIEALQRELRGEVSPGLAKLDSEYLSLLAEAVADAKRRQAAEIAAAGDQALKYVPRLLRIAIRKVMS